MLFIHHAKKDSADGWPEFRGSGAIEDQVDLSFSVKKTDVSAERKTVEIRCEKPGDMRKPDPFAVEVAFDDAKRTATLRHVEQVPGAKAPEASIENKMRARIVEILKGQPAGTPKQRLLDAIKGKTDTKKEVSRR